MSRRAEVVPASLPLAGLPGLDERFSRIVSVPSQAGPEHAWHVLDNGDQLAALGVEPIGTVLCVHGNPTWSYVWRSLVSAATNAATDAATPAAANVAAETAKPPSGAWRVVAVDQLEMGYSERTGTTQRLADRIADLGDLTDALGITGPVVTLGHDWGGVVSLGWAIDHPQQLAGVMALNTAVHQPAGVPIPAPLRLALAGPVLEPGTVASQAFLRVTLGLAHPPLSPQVHAAYVAPYASAALRRGIGDFVADIPTDVRHPSHSELRRVAEGVRDLEVPALLLWGPRDPIFSDRYLADLIERVPHADVHRFEGAGHLIAEDIDYAATVLRWLNERVSVLAEGSASESPAAEQPSETAQPSSGPAIPSELPPLWASLIELRESDDAALVEMAPPGGGGPLTVSWRLLARRVAELAAGLTAFGVSRGDRVSVLVPAGADLTAVLYACLRIGAVVVVADAGLGLPALSRAVRGSWPDHVIGIDRALVAAKAMGWPGQKFSTHRFPSAVARSLGVSASLGQLVEAGRHAPSLPVAPAADELAAILFTSGSTGPPKGVAYTHGQLSALAAVLRQQYDVTPGTGLVAGFAPFALLGPALGATSVTPDMDVTSPATLTAVAVADAAAAVDARIVFASPAALANVLRTADMLEAPHRSALSQVRTLLSAGAPLSEKLLARVAKLFPAASVHTPYGMTEALLLTDITLEGIRDAAAASAEQLGGGVCVGLPTASATVLISALDESGDAVGAPSDLAGVTGEIVVSAPHIKDHYDRLWETQRASEAIRGSVPEGRWHRTGDVGHLDDAGRLWVEGRLPHVIVTPYGAVTPVGPEQHAEGVWGIARAAAVGIGPKGTQQVVIVAETDPAARRCSVAGAELTASVRAATGLPIAAVLLVPLLPTDIRHNSKIDRGALAIWASAVLAGGPLRRPT